MEADRQVRSMPVCLGRNILNCILNNKFWIVVVVVVSLELVMISLSRQAHDSYRSYRALLVADSARLYSYCMGQRDEFEHGLLVFRNLPRYKVSIDDEEIVFESCTSNGVQDVYVDVSRVDPEMFLICTSNGDVYHIDYRMMQYLIEGRDFKGHYDRSVHGWTEMK